MRFTIFPVFVALMLTSGLYAQEIDPATITKKSNIKWGFSSSIDYSNRTLVNRTDDPMFDDFISLYDQLEVGSIGYSAGIAMQVSLNPRLMLNTGLTYSRQGHQTTLREAQWPSEVEDGEYKPDPNLDGSYKYLYRFYYANLPLTLRYYICANKRWFISGGLMTNLLIKATSVLVWQEDGNTDRSKNDRNYDFALFNLSPEIGFGKEFQLHNNTSLQLSPVFRYGLIPVNENKIAEYHWSMGMTMQLLFGDKVQRGSNN